MAVASQPRGNGNEASNVVTISGLRRQVTFESAGIGAGGSILWENLRRFGPALATAAGYYVGTRIGFALTPVEQPISTFWPPNAILFAALLLMPPSRWAGALLAVLPIHLFVQLGTGVPLNMALGWYVSNVSEALLGAALLRRVARDTPLFASLLGVTYFIFFGVFVAPFLTSFLDAGLVVLTGWGTSFWELWKKRLFSNMLASVLIVPPIVIAGRGLVGWIKRAKLRDCAEVLLLVAGMMLVAAFVLNTTHPSWSSIPVLLYTLLPLLLWTAVRHGPGAVSGALLLIAILAVWTAMHGRGPFASGTLTQNVFSLQVFLGVTSVPLLALAAAVQERLATLEFLRSKEEMLRLDIAEREIAEKHLVESQRRYEMATAAAGVVVWEWNLQTNRVYFDPVLPNIVRSAPEDLTHDQWLGWVHREDRSRVDATLRSLSPEKSRFDLEYRVVDKDGEMKWLHHQGTCHAEAAGMVRVVGTLTDITDRKLALLRLAESEQRFRQTADAAPMLVWMCDQNNMGTYFNRAWLEFTGRRLEEELGLGWAENVHPEDANESIATCEAAFKARRQFRMEYRLRRQDGEYRWLLEHGVPRFDANGVLLGFIGSAIDITDRKKAEEAVMNSSARLIQAQEEERKKIARELHDDVGQRLALLSIGLDHLREKLTASLRSGATRLWNQSEELSDVVHDISHNLHSPKLDWLGLSTALKALLEDFGQEHSMLVSFSEHNVPAQIPQNTKLALYRITQEALQNVIKHSRAHVVSLELNSNDGTLELKITDDGVGFILEQQPILGMGIANMQERLRAIGGTIRISSVATKGTTVEASVPLR